MEDRMHTTGRHRLTHAVRLATVAALCAACAGEPPLGPGAAPPANRAASAGREVELGPCERLRAPTGSVLAAHLYARGVQIYRWNGAGWLFEGPAAGLYADARFTGQVGTHSAGPKWVHFGGSTVHGSSPEVCPVDPDAIPWLLLRASADPGGGIFRGVTAIQRVNTVGGRMPSGAGAAPGELRQVPYTAEYYFYRQR
jgi:hypothetical protein